MSLRELYVRWDGTGERYGTLTHERSDEWSESFSVRRVLSDEAVERMLPELRRLTRIWHTPDETLRPIAATLFAAAVGGEGL